MVALIFSVTFASIDWYMSLEPEWFSTIYGFIFVGAWSSERARVCHRRDGWLVRQEPMKRIVAPLALSRPRQTAAGARHAVGLLRVFAVSDYLVRQSSGRDRLVHRAHTRRTGAQLSSRSGYSTLRRRFCSCCRVVSNAIRASWCDRGIDPRDACRRSAMDACAGVSGSQMDLARRDRVRYLVLVGCGWRSLPGSWANDR
jgi:hypothetical protein